MIGGIKRMLYVSCRMMTPLDIARFLAVQEPDDELVYRIIPVCISPINIIAKIGIQGFFPRSLDGPIEHFCELGIAFYFYPFLLHIGLQELRLCESNKEFNTVGSIIGYHFGTNLGGVLEILFAYGGLS